MNDKRHTWNECCIGLPAPYVTMVVDEDSRELNRARRLPNMAVALFSSGLHDRTFSSEACFRNGSRTAKREEEAHRR